jgi:hypothetical protein
MASAPTTTTTETAVVRPKHSERGGGNNKKKPLSTHLIAGGGAGFVEAMCCHPLDTIKVRMQLRGKRSVSSWCAFGSLGRPIFGHKKQSPLTQPLPFYSTVHAGKNQLYWCGPSHRHQRGTTRFVQGLGRCCFWNRSQDGHTFLFI